ncbi:MAG: hypothetical protein MI919_30600 [Holophagales bacterium]|nr:hypothetical protein [Holophagales bacterium]
MTRRLRHVSLLLALLLLATALPAAEGSATDPGTDPPVAASATGGAPAADPAARPAEAAPHALEHAVGPVRKVRTQEAYRLRSTLQALFSAPKTDAEPVTHDNGMVSVTLHESMLRVTVAQVLEDGDLEQGCVDEASHPSTWAEPMARRLGEEKP